MIKRAPRHSLAQADSSQFRTVINGTMLLTAAITISLLATGGSYALWNTTAPVKGATITSGSLALSIKASTAADSTLVTNYAVSGLDVNALLPGRSVVTASPMTFKNTGSTRLSFDLSKTIVTYTAGTTDLTSKLAPVLRQSAACSLSPAGAAPVPSTSAIVLEPGASLPVCLEVGLNSSAIATVQGKTASFTITLAVTQAR